MLRSDRADDEYLIAPSRFATQQKLPTYIRLRVAKFQKEWGESSLVIKESDLQSAEYRRLLLQCVDDWPRKQLNNISKAHRDMLTRAIVYGSELKVRSLCLYINGSLQGYCIYLRPKKQLVQIMAVQINYKIPRVFDYMVHSFMRHFDAQGVMYVNLGSDGGSLLLRAIKIALKPDNFFHKYIIEPAGSRHVTWPLSKSRHYY